MNVLISNDDGILSNGLKSLVNKFNKDNNVLVVAPDGNRSASSHSITIAKKIKLKDVSEQMNCKAFSISGTPADCIKFAKLVFPDFDADVVLSGINKGHNLGSDILYSGTVGIACEAAFFGNIAFAFSAFSLEESNFDLYSEYAYKIVNTLLPLSKAGDIWNINFPDDTKTGIQGIKITPLGKQLYTDCYVKDRCGDYMLVGELIDHDQNVSDCDIEWIKRGYITITPILFDKSNYKKISEVSEICEKLL